MYDILYNMAEALWNLADNEECNEIQEALLTAYRSVENAATVVDSLEFIKAVEDANKDIRGVIPMQK